MIFIIFAKESLLFQVYLNFLNQNKILNKISNLDQDLEKFHLDFLNPYFREPQSDIDHEACEYFS